MIRQYGGANPGGSTIPQSAVVGGHSETNGSNISAKVAEVFLTAGHAFQKLGDLTLQLHTSSNDVDENKWTVKDVDQLRESLTRFAHELDNISESVQTRTSKLIKKDIKRRAALGGGEELRCGSPAAKRAPTTMGQMLVAQNAPGPKRAPGTLMPSGAGGISVGIGAPSTSSVPVGTQFSPVMAPGGTMAGPSPRGIPFTSRTARYAPAGPSTGPAVAATVTLQSSPQPIATRTSTILPPEPAHYIDTPNS